MTLGHILRVEMREVSRRPDGDTRWCFRCRRKIAFVRVVSTPLDEMSYYVDEMSYYGPSVRIVCEAGHTDGDCFPGRHREWSDYLDGLGSTTASPP